MQVRLDPDIAKKVKREVRSHYHMFKRRRSYTTEVNLMLRDYLFENGSSPIRSSTGKHTIDNCVNVPAKHTP